MKYTTLIIHTLLFVYLSSCSMLDGGDPSIDEKPVAKVYDEQLYPEEMALVIPKGLSKSDSVVIAKNFIQSWIDEKLLLHKAYEAIDPTDFNIERKIEKFRDQLIIYEFENKFLNQNLNKKVSEEEIKAYYKEQKENFELQQPIVKGYFVKVKKESPNISTGKRLTKNATPSNLDDLKNFCFEEAESYNLNDSIWYFINDFTASSPLEEVSNITWVLKNQRFVEKSDSSYTYFLKINELQEKGTAPIELVEEQIKEIIISKRRMELKNNMSKELYNKAKENEEIIIY